MTTTGPNTLTYAQNGANSTSTGGTMSVLTGGYALYPMAEVLSVLDPATKSVDGQMTLAPNTVAWAANDPVEQPHYFQEQVSADLSLWGRRRRGRRLRCERACSMRQQRAGAAGLDGDEFDAGDELTWATAGRILLRMGV